MGPFTEGSIPRTPNVFNVLHDDGSAWGLSVYNEINGSLTLPDGTSVTATDAPNVMTVSGNTITLKWNSPSLFTQVGEYRLQFNFSDVSGDLDYSKIITFSVEPVALVDETTYWCTLNDILQITGQSASEEQLGQAQFVIDSVSHRTTAQINRIKPRDLVYLKRALAYQTIWQAAHPDIFTKTAFDGIVQDGFSGKLFNKSGNFLGPLAEMALKNCSWLRSRSLRTSNPFVDGDYDMSLNPLADDSILDWERI